MRNHLSDYREIIYRVKYLEVGLSPAVDGIKLDDASELNVFSCVRNVELILDVLVEVDRAESVDGNICLDFSAETAAVVLGLHN